jgi:hypothetical protein
MVNSVGGFRTSSPPAEDAAGVGMAGRQSSWPMEERGRGGEDRAAVVMAGGGAREGRGRPGSARSGRRRMRQGWGRPVDARSGWRRMWHGR